MSSQDELSVRELSMRELVDVVTPLIEALGKTCASYCVAFATSDPDGAAVQALRVAALAPVVAAAIDRIASRDVPGGAA